MYVLPTSKLKLTEYTLFATAFREKRIRTGNSELHSKLGINYEIIEKNKSILMSCYPFGKTNAFST
jgi:hypothetical protein